MLRIGTQEPLRQVAAQEMEKEEERDSLPRYQSDIYIQRLEISTSLQLFSSFFSLS
jgi:hypothetical protein